INKSADMFIKSLFYVRAIAHAQLKQRPLQLQRPLFLCPVKENANEFSFQQIKLKMLKVSRGS
ncbi:MAG: hypothetical protein RSF00_08570, partial [Oscillospiraceae bacterium]